MDDKELLSAQEDDVSGGVSGSEYLQESGDTVAQMIHKFKTSHQKATSDLKPTEISQLEALQKYEFLEQEIGSMIKRGDVGTPVVDTRTNQPVQGDLDFLGEKKKIPEDLKKEM